MFPRETLNVESLLKLYALVRRNYEEKPDALVQVRVQRSIPRLLECFWSSIASLRAKSSSL